MVAIADILLSEIEKFYFESEKIMAYNLIKKIDTFSHAPLNKKHGLRMMPFIESSNVISVISKITYDYELKFMVYENSISDFDIIGYYYCIDLLILCIVYQKGNCDKILTVLEHEIDKENEHNKITKRNGGKVSNVMLRIFNFFKKDTDKLDYLIQKLIPS
jgi:hypothetical protein